MYAFNTVLLLSFKIHGLYLLVIRGVPSLIVAPVDGYRKGGATPICTWSPAKSGSWDMLHVGLEHVGSLHAILHML